MEKYRPVDPWRDRAALAMLAPLWIALGVFAFATRWSSNYGVDAMTLWEQVRAVADHGTIDFDNGPVEQYAELRPRWFVARGGRAWGIVPVVASYVFAPFARLGDFAGAVRANWLFLGIAATLTYGLVRRLTGHRAVAVGGAYALAFGTSFPGWCNHVNPFVLLGCASVASLYAAHHAFRAEGARAAGAWGALSGLAASVALGTHLTYALPWGFGGLSMLRAGTLRERLARAAGYGLASAPSIALMSWVNHQRFGIWNPVSYGPCDSTSCTGTANNQTSDAFLETIRPARPWFIAFCVALWAARRSPRASAAVAFFGACGALIPETQTRPQLSKFLRVLWGYTVNLGSLDIPGYQRPADGVGTMLLDYCVRSPLQCAPWIAAALLARQVHHVESRRAPRERVADADGALRTMAALVVAGVVAACMLRVDTGGFDVWGFPILNIRYVLGAVPAAAVLALVTASELPWHPLQLAALAPCAAAFALALWARTDADPWRRLATLLFPLYGVAALWGAASIARAARSDAVRAAAGYAASTLLLAGALYGAAVSATIDRQFARDFRGPQEARAQEVDRCTRGHRGVILLGGYALDESLAVHGTREVLFINVGMGPRDGRNARELVARYEAPDRPAFLLNDTPEGPWRFTWEGFRFDPVPGCPRVLRIARAAR